MTGGPGPGAGRVCVIHTGLHKTGTSAVQARLAASAGALAAAGILYPAAGRSKGAEASPAHHRIAATILNGAADAAGERALQGLAAEIAHTPHRALVISSELVSSSLLKREPFRVPAYFAALGYRVKLLTYLRQQGDFLVSRYVQRVKTLHEARSFAAFCDPILADPRHLSDQVDRAARARGMVAEFRPFSAALRREGIERPFLTGLFALCEVAEGAEAEALAARCLATPLPRVNERIGPLDLALRRSVVRGIENGPSVCRDHGRYVERRITALLAAQGRQPEPRYDVADAAFLARVEAAFGPTNDAFARRVWGMGWHEAFGGPPVPVEPNDIEVTRDPALVALHDRLLPRLLRRFRRRVAVQGLAGDLGARLGGLFGRKEPA